MKKLSTNNLFHNFVPSFERIKSILTTNNTRSRKLRSSEIS